jgi:hypothetical protein
MAMVTPLFVSVALAQHEPLLDEDSATFENRTCGERPCQMLIFASDVKSEPDSFLPPTVSTPGEIAAMAPGTWLQYGRPWTDAAPNPVPCGKPFRNILNAWNGWVRDGLRYAYVAANGGHGDGCDNGVYRYDIQTGTAELYVPHVQPNGDLETTRPIVIDENGVQIRPRSSHTYFGQFIDRDWLYHVPGSAFRDGKTDGQVWRFHVVEKRWEQLPDRRKENGKVYGQVVSMILNTPDGPIIMGKWDLCTIDLHAPVGPGKARCQKDHSFGSRSGVAWDAARNGIWHIDPKKAHIDFLAREADTLEFVQNTALSGTIAPDVLVDLSSGPGICVLPNDAILVWSKSNKLHRWDGSSWATIDVPGPPTVAKRGIYSKWSWDEQSKTCIGAASVDQGLWVYKPVMNGASDPTPEPKQDPDSASTPNEANLDYPETRNYVMRFEAHP